MTDWDVADRSDFWDFQDEAETERYLDERREAQYDEWRKVALHCAACDARWMPRGTEKNPQACPRCGSERKAAR